ACSTMSWPLLAALPATASRAGVGWIVSAAARERADLRVRRAAGAESPAGVCGGGRRGRPGGGEGSAYTVAPAGGGASATVLRAGVVDLADVGVAEAGAGAGTGAADVGGPVSDAPH